MSRVVQAGTIPFLVVMVALIVLYFATLKRWTGRTRAFFDRYPPWSMYRMFVGAGFMISLSALIRADVPMPKALEKLREGADPYLEARITSALRGVMNGVNIGEALYQSGYGFPDPQIVRDLRIYGQMTGFSEMLDKISKRWVDRAAKRIGSIAATLNALMLVALGGILVFVAFGLFAITNQISQAAMFSV
jgi:type II secretory pathway component PulF